MFYNFIKIIASVIFKIGYRVKVKGIENVPLKGKFVLCSNHANNLDPILVSIAFPRQISWMAKKELFTNKLLSKFLTKLGAFPVDRGDSDISAIKNALRVLKNDGVLGIFPEGTRVKAFDIENAKPGVALLTIKSKSNVIPVKIEGNYKLFSSMKIIIGKPIDFSLEEGQTKDYTEISKNILSSIYELRSEENIGDNNS